MPHGLSRDSYQHCLRSQSGDWCIPSPWAGPCASLACGAIGAGMRLVASLLIPSAVPLRSPAQPARCFLQSRMSLESKSYASWALQSALPAEPIR